MGYSILLSKNSLALAQTGSGKTHTMWGADPAKAAARAVGRPLAEMAADVDAGIIPRALASLFAIREERARDWAIEVRAAALSSFTSSHPFLFAFASSCLQPARLTSAPQFALPHRNATG